MAPQTTDVEIPQLEGVDIEASLDRLQGNRALYLKLLNQFSGHYGDFDTQLDTALATGDSEPAIRLAHTIKGLAGNIGASEMAGAAEKAERELLQGSCSEETLGALRVSVNNLLTQLRGSLIDLPRASDNSVFDKTKAGQLLLQLSSMLEEYDVSVGEFLGDHNASLNTPVLSGELKCLLKAVADYDYETAQNTVSQMTAKLERPGQVSQDE